MTAVESQHSSCLYFPHRQSYHNPLMGRMQFVHEILGTCGYKKIISFVVVMFCYDVKKFIPKSNSLIIGQYHYSMTSFYLGIGRMREMRYCTEPYYVFILIIQSIALRRYIQFRIQIMISPKYLPFFSPTTSDMKSFGRLWAIQKELHILLVSNTHCGCNHWRMS